MRLGRRTLLATILIAVAAPSHALAQTAARSACAAPDALRAAGETKTAQKIYIKILERD